MGLFVTATYLMLACLCCGLVSVRCFVVPLFTFGTRSSSVGASAPNFAGMGNANEDCFAYHNSDRFDTNDKTIKARRAALRTLAFTPFAWIRVGGVGQAAAKGIKPDVAFDNLLKAREELLVAAKTYLLDKKDYDGLRAYLFDEATNINNFESNALALLESKQLDAESKKEIGTIRRYGVGADVMIMYGGLTGELDNEEPNYGEVQKYMKRTLDSLDEVIAICRSNGF